MGRDHTPLPPELGKRLRGLGERIALARMRRGISASLMAERLGISRTTLNRLEKGEAMLGIGTFLRALRILGLDGDVDILARDDPVGRALQDEQTKKGRGPHG